MLDLAIIGGGPAALAAAIYAGRANLKVEIFERKAFGGLLNEIHVIENYPGYIGSGFGLYENMRKVAENCGAKLSYGECSELAKKDDHFEFLIDGEERLKARKVLVASGSERRKLNIPGEDSPRVSYCAICDAPLTRGKTILVIGGGNAAAQEALTIAKYADAVTILSRSPMHCDASLMDRVRKAPKITVIEDVSAQSLRDEHKLKLTAVDGREFEADMLFVFIGNHPATSFLPKSVLATDEGVVVDAKQETAIEGLFAAGDCVHGVLRQVITAASAGAIAAHQAIEELQKAQKK